MLLLPAAALCCLCSALAAMAAELTQDQLSLTRTVGDRASFSCGGTDQCAWIRWFQKEDKGTFRQILFIDISDGAVYPDYNHPQNDDFTANKKQNSCELKIWRVEPSHAATYYCACEKSGPHRTKLFVTDTPVVKPVVSVYPAAATAALDGKMSLLCVASDMFPPVVHFYWTRQREGENPSPAKGEQLELRGDGPAAAIMVVDRDASHTYKYSCHVRHEGGTVEAPAEQEVCKLPAPTPPAQTPPAQTTPSSPPAPKPPAPTTPSSPPAPKPPAPTTPSSPSAPKPPAPKPPAQTTPSSPPAPKPPAQTTPSSPPAPKPPAQTTPSSPPAPKPPAPTTPSSPPAPKPPAQTTPSSPPAPKPPAPTTPSSPPAPKPPAPTTPSSPPAPKPPAQTTPSSPSAPKPPAPTTPSSPSAQTTPAQTTPSSPPAPTPPAQTPPAPTPPAQTPPAAWARSQRQVKLLVLLYTLLMVKSLVYCCGLALINLLRSRERPAAEHQTTEFPPAASASH